MFSPRGASMVEHDLGASKAWLARFAPSEERAERRVAAAETRVGKWISGWSTWLKGSANPGPSDSLTPERAPARPAAGRTFQESPDLGASQAWLDRPGPAPSEPLRSRPVAPAGEAIRAANRASRARRDAQLAEISKRGA